MLRLAHHAPPGSYLVRQSATHSPMRFDVGAKEIARLTCASEVRACAQAGAQGRPAARFESLTFRSRPLATWAASTRTTLPRAVGPYLAHDHGISVSSSR